MGEASVWSASVVQFHRLRHDVAVVRLIGDAIPFEPGQSVAVAVPQNPRAIRRYSPALPPSLDGKLEFHVRTVPAGWISGAIVTRTQPGDLWRFTEPAGRLAIDESGRDVIMVAGGTGLAPLRALLLDLTRWEDPPRVYLFYGAAFPRDLYAADMLVLMAADLPWLTVIPVVEHVLDPWASDEWHSRIYAELGSAVAGFDPDDLLQGALPDVVAAHGPFTEHQVLVCGSPGMTAATVDRLMEGGTPGSRDPLLVLHCSLPKISMRVTSGADSIDRNQRGRRSGDAGGPSEIGCSSNGSE